MILDINCGPCNYLQGLVHTSFKKVNNKGKYVTKQVIFYGSIQRYFYFDWQCIIQSIFSIGWAKSRYKDHQYYTISYCIPTFGPSCINEYRSQEGKLNRQ